MASSGFALHFSTYWNGLPLYVTIMFSVSVSTKYLKLEVATFYFFVPLESLLTSFSETVLLFILALFILLDLSFVVSLTITSFILLLSSWQY